MLPYNARINNQGFTLIETTIIVVIVGILSAIAAPSFLGMLNRNKVNDALVQVRGALQEAQREAIRRSKSCTITLDTINNKVTAPCLVTGDRKLESVAIRSSNSSITFNFKGNVGIGGGSTIVIASSNNSTTKQKCLAIASGIGIMRTGDYHQTDTTGTDSNKCTLSQ